MVSLSIMVLEGHLISCLAEMYCLTNIVLRKSSRLCGYDVNSRRKLKIIIIINYNYGSHTNSNTIRLEEDRLLKFIYSEKATKFCEISNLLLTVCTVVKSKVEISQNFVAFSEYMNFINKNDQATISIFSLAHG